MVSAASEKFRPWGGVAKLNMSISRLTRNIKFNLVGQALLLILGFIAVKYIHQKLGEDTLGIIYFASAMNVILCGILEKGVHATNIREVSENYNDSSSYIKEFIRTGSLFCWLMYCIFSIVVYCGAPFLVKNWINLKSLDHQTAISVLRLLGISSLFGFPQSHYSSLIRGLQRMGINNIVDVASSAIQQFGILFILTNGDSLYSVVYFIFFCQALKTLVYLYYVGCFWGWGVTIPGYSRSVVLKNIEFTKKMVSISFMAMVIRQADQVIISKLLPISLLGYYSFAYGIINNAGFVSNAIGNAAYPTLCSLYKKGNNENLLSMFRKLQDLICFMTVPAFVLIPIFARHIFSFTFNDTVSSQLLLPTILLSLGFYMNGTISIYYKLVLAVGRPEIIVRLSRYTLFLIPLATLLFVYFWGLVGAGLGWVLYPFFYYVYGIPVIYSAGGIGEPPRVFYSRLIRILILTIMSYGLMLMIIFYFNFSSIFALTVASIVGSFVYCVGAYFMAGDELRESIVRYIQQLRKILPFLREFYV